MPTYAWQKTYALKDTDVTKRRNYAYIFVKIKAVKMRECVM